MSTAGRFVARRLCFVIIGLIAERMSTKSSSRGADRKRKPVERREGDVKESRKRLQGAATFLADSNSLTFCAWESDEDPHILAGINLSSGTLDGTVGKSFVTNQEVESMAIEFARIGLDGIGIASLSLVFAYRPVPKCRRIGVKVEFDGYTMTAKLTVIHPTDKSRFLKYFGRPIAA